MTQAPSAIFKIPTKAATSCTAPPSPPRWRDGHGGGQWTWHSLRHVFCTTALFTWKLDPTDVSRMAGHANVRITLDMYIGTTAGTLDRARTATE
jgi:integrase